MPNDSVAATADTEVMTTVDGTPLKVSLRRAIRRTKIRAAMLVVPLAAFIVFTFAIPILVMLWRSVDNPEVHTIMPKTVAALQNWDGKELPGEPVFAALAADLKHGRQTREIGKVATRLNYEDPGMRSTIMKSARHSMRLEPPYKDKLIKIDKRWGEIGTWHLIKRESAPYTLSYYLAAFDLQYDAAGNIVEVPSYQQIYVKLFWRTIWMSAMITGFTILLGYPVAYLLANLPLRHSNLLMILVLLPFWTSLLVRTTTWIVLLQSQGVLNDILVATGIIDDAHRIQLIFNKIGTTVAMTHILLPFMILPLYSVMKTIPPSYMRAARSLGANQLVAFVRVYVPQTMAGIGAGSILVFILSIGYYITPALVGGQSGRFITNFIAYHMQQSLNWGLAAAISSILLFTVLVFYLLYNKLIGIDKMKLG